MGYCYKCSATFPEGAKFCTACGTPCGARERGSQPNMSAVREKISGAIGCVFLLLIVSGLIFALVESADQHGWLSHEVDATITASGDWFVGETRECTSYPVPPDGAALNAVLCGGKTERLMRITFYGRKKQPEYTAVFWKCTRTTEGFTCLETSGVRRVTAEEFLRRVAPDLVK